MRVGKGVVLASESQLTQRDAYGLSEHWHSVLPDVPLIIVNDCRIVQNEGEPILFEFTGGITETFVAEFQRWWKEASGG